jgi:hypothetical protein
LPGGWLVAGIDRPARWLPQLLDKTAMMTMICAMAAFRCAVSVSLAAGSDLFSAIGTMLLLGLMVTMSWCWLPAASTSDSSD